MPDIGLQSYCTLYLMFHPPHSRHPHRLASRITLFPLSLQPFHFQTTP